MEVEVTILSTTLVAPTPRPSQEFQRLPLTGFDLRMLKFPPMRRLFLFDAKAHEDQLIVEQVNETLRESLSRALAEYYPFAGRLVQEEDGEAVINCNNAGVEFIEASAPISVRELKNYHMASTYQRFAQAIPFKFQDLGTCSGPLFGAQVTHLKCGGYAIGYAYFHAIADGATVWQFMKSWAEAARGEPISLPPSLSSRANVIKLASESVANSDPETLSSESFLEKLPLMGNPYVPTSTGPNAVAAPDATTLHILFDLPMQKKLKAKALEEVPDGSTFSTYVVISAHVWRAITRARLLGDMEETRYFNTVDCRKRWPELPQNYFGNAILEAVAVTTVRNLLGNGISYAANLLHKSIADLTSEHIRSLLTRMEKGKKEWIFLLDARPLTDVSTAGSIRFPSLEHSDFGWGPAFYYPFMYEMAPCALIYWRPKRSDGTIEMVFTLPPDVSKRLQEDEDFISCVSGLTAVTLRWR